MSRHVSGKPALPFTPGVELCGTVELCGDGVTAYHVGDRVIGSSLLPAGAFAEYALIDQMTTFPAPTRLQDAEAACLYLGYQTSWFALRRRTHLQPGEWLLVHAAAGGVGSAAVQLGKAAGARVIGVVGDEERARYAIDLGADLVIDGFSHDFVPIVKEVTEGRGADVIYDPVGGPTYKRSTKCVAFEGRIVLIGFAGGEIQNVALNHPLIKNYSVLGLHWGLYRKRNLPAVAECQRELTRLADDTGLRPLVSRRMQIEDVGAGVQDLAEGLTVGRLTFVAWPQG